MSRDQDQTTALQKAAAMIVHAWQQEYPAGTSVLVRFGLVRSGARFKSGTILHSGLLCSEDGLPTYRIAFADGIEADICHSVVEVAAKEESHG